MQVLTIIFMSGLGLFAIYEIAQLVRVIRNKKKGKKTSKGVEASNDKKEEKGDEQH